MYNFNRPKDKFRRTTYHNSTYYEYLCKPELTYRYSLIFSGTRLKAKVKSIKYNQSELKVKTKKELRRRVFMLNNTKVFISTYGIGRNSQCYKFMFKIKRG